MGAPEFVHLHVHSAYSLLDGTCRVEDLAARVAELGMRAVALTDHGALYGVPAFVQACQRHGVKPILGCEVYLVPRRHDHAPGEPWHLTLLAAGPEGYRSLVELVTLGWAEGLWGKPRVDWEALGRHSRDLICLTGCRRGPVAAPLLAGREDEAATAARRLLDLFGSGNVYVELQDQGLPDQPDLNRRLVALARSLGLPVVATHNVHYLRREDARLHDLVLCMGSGRTLQDPDRPRYPGDDFYLKSPAEMALRFGHLPESLQATLAIAERCTATVPFGPPMLPAFPLPPGFASASAYLRHLCQEALPARYPAAGPEVYARLEHELAIIDRMGYAGYFLIVWDFVRYARSRGIAVGPGRGSGAGSLVAYLLGITGIDPLAHGLLFERFLNPERVDMPDFDIDFDYERRGEVIDYVVQRYGADRVAQIGTFGTLQARAAVRDVGRALGLPPAAVDRVARAIPFGVDLATALREVPEVQEAVAGEPALQELVRLALAVEGLPRHASVHAAGVVIAPGPLTRWVPLYRTADGHLATQYDMDQLKAIGLLKMDFLGLRTLTVVHRAAASAGVSLESIPLDDPATYAMLGRGETVGLFQLEAAWVADVLRQMQPRCFADITAAISLCRPGPMQHIPQYLAARQEGARYPHPDLEPILRDTYGILIYQEQIMEVAARIAGFSLGAADLLRRAVGKKDREALERYRDRFLEGAAARGYSRELAAALYDDILRFASYGFNKSHAAAYALLAYQTAYLKCHHPVAFLTALLNSVLGAEKKVALYVAECRRLGIAVLPPDVQQSGPGFAPAGARAIRFGLAAIKHVGWQAAAAIARAREEGGPFASLADLLARVDPRYLPRRAVESLIRAGALDSLGATRPELLAQLEAAGGACARPRPGQVTLFDLAGPGGAADGGSAGGAGGTGAGAGGGAAAAPPPVPPHLLAQYLQMEKEALGFYLSGHPLQHRAADLERAGAVPAAALADLGHGQPVTVAGMLVRTRRTTTRGGEAMAFLQLEDLTGTVEVVVFPRVLDRVRRHLRPDAVLLVRGRLELQEEEGDPRVLASEVLPLPAGTADAPAATGSGAPAPGAAGAVAVPPDAVRSGDPPPVLYLRVYTGGPDDPVLQRLQALLEAHPGPSPVRIKLEPAGRWVEVPHHRRVQVGPGLLQELAALLGEPNVAVRPGR